MNAVISEKIVDAVAAALSMLFSPRRLWMLLLRHCECSEKNVDAVVVAGNVNAALSEKNVDCGCCYSSEHCECCSLRRKKY